VKPDAALIDARTARSRAYEEALEGYIWFHENASNELGVSRLRLSFALSNWIELGRCYPPARVALEKIRDRKTKSLLKGMRDIPFFQDVVSIKHVSGCERATYELFVELNASFRCSHKCLRGTAMRAIVNCGDFELARQVMPSPEEQLHRFVEAFRLMSARSRLAKIRSKLRASRQSPAQKASSH